MLTIRKLRESRGWTQEELAYRAGVRASTVSAYETGTRSPTTKLLRPIAEAMGVILPGLFDKEGGLAVNSQEFLDLLLERLKREEGLSEEQRRRVEHYVDLIKMELRPTPN